MQQALQKFRHIHFVGVGGAGMGPIAQVLLAQGVKVSGSDVAESAMTEKLRQMGGSVTIGHAPDNIEGADLVVLSTAIRPDNSERAAAEAAGLTIWHRAEILAELMRAGRSIAVCGTHGKTTTTSMLGLMLTEAGLDPTVLIGGWLAHFGGNARIGKGPWVVAEADESDGSLLKMSPDRIVLTNIEADHLDHYTGGLAEIERTFAQFVSQLAEGGRVFACIDDPIVRRLMREHDWPAVTYGLRDPAARMVARAVAPTGDGAGMTFVPVWDGEALPAVNLSVPGEHNVANALGALACGLDCGASFETMAYALEGFSGAKRRFEFKGEARGVRVFDDYGHHPTELTATLRAARGRMERTGEQRLVVLFQPHRYSRTASFVDEFGQALRDSDMVAVTEVYSAGEDPIEGATGRAVYERVLAHGHANAHFVETLEDARDLLCERLEPGDLMLTMGAGSVWRVGESVLADLRLRSGAALG